MGDNTEGASLFVKGGLLDQNLVKVFYLDGDTGLFYCLQTGNSIRDLKGS